MEQDALQRLYTYFGVSQALKQHDEFDAQVLSWLTSYLNSRHQLLTIEEDQTLVSFVSAPSRLAAFSYLLAHVAEQLTDTVRPTLRQLVVSLQASDVQDNIPLSNGTDGRGPNANRIIEALVFKAIGWLTMLYEPRVSTGSGNTVSVQQPMDIKGQPVFSQVLSATKNLQTGKDRLPVYLLLKYIGQDLIPRPSIGTDPTLYKTSVRPDFFSEQIVASYVNYVSLRKVAKIELEFVAVLSMHLEFDEQTKKLKVFAFPSWCALMTHGRASARMLRTVESAQELQGTPYLSSLLRSYLRGESGRGETEELEEEENSGDNYSDLCREILLSYHLLFGYNERASSLFRNDYRKYLRQSPPTCYPTDSLMLELWSKSQNPALSRAGIVLTKSQYSAQKDFPFLGRRLVQLQRFVAESDPTDWQTLLNDKRDILRFWTFWAVIWIGGSSIILSAVQVALSAAQLAVTLRQS